MDRPDWLKVPVRTEANADWTGGDALFLLTPPPHTHTYGTTTDNPRGPALLMLSIDGVGEEGERGRKGQEVAVATYSEDMKEDSGPTSFAFCSACFSLKAASASSSS